MSQNNFMQNFWQFLAAIAIFFAGLFYFLFRQEKIAGFKIKLETAKNEAKKKAQERNEKVKDDSITTANDISKILDS